MELLEKISEELQNGNFIDVPKLTQEALVQGISPALILSELGVLPSSPPWGSERPRRPRPARQRSLG